MRSRGNHDVDVVVVGAGISGMATAYRLQAAGLSVKVFEGNSHPGGKMDSVVKNGFQFETGPILIPNTYSSLLSLLEDLGLGDKLHAIEGPMAIVKDGQVKRLRIPHMGMDLIRSGLLGWKSLLSLTRLAIPLLKNRKALGYADLSDAAHLDTQSVRQFCDRGITDEAYENLLDTALRATYMHSADEASIVELLWVLNNIIANKVYYLDGGTSIITRNMQETLDITCNATVTDVTEHDDGVTVSVTDKSGSESSISAQHCVVATDPVALAKLLRNWLKPEQLDFLTSYNYGRFIYVGLGLEGSTAESAYLLQIPAKEHPELVGIALDHNRSQAPNQKSVVTTFFLDEWSERMAGASDETIRDLAIEAVSPFIPEVKSSVVEYHVKHTEPGVTMSKVGDYRKLAAFTAALNDDSPIRIVGDFFSMSSMNTCVARADVASQSIIRAAQNT